MVNSVKSIEAPEGMSRRIALLEKYGLVTADFTIKLPSNGWLYPKYEDGTPISEVKLRGLTVKEMKWLPTTDVGSASLLNRLLASIIIPPDKGWPAGLTNEKFVRMLVDGDVPALLLGMRICTFGLEYRAPVVCWSCAHTYTRDVSLSEEVDIKHLEVQPRSDGLFEFRDPDIFRNSNVVFRLLTLEDEEAITSSVEERKKRGLSAEQDPVIERLLASVVSIGDESDKSDIKFMLNHVPLNMIEKFVENVSKIDFGPRLDSIETTCPQCNTKDKMTIPLAGLVLSR